MKPYISFLIKMDQLVRKYDFGLWFDISNKLSKRYLIKHKSNIKFIMDNQEDFWLLAQHADYDLNLQCTYYIILKKEHANKTNLAYLLDRILVNKSNVQLYGTQYYHNECGIYGPYPILRPEKLEQRRKICNMETMEEYHKLMTQRH